ncbi:cytochrome c oxidase subunit 7A2, mitochondrial-like [Homarus americanus]|uniref:cytochrome c oxidase subunit 7A2, mitochondrial-like n=1 Tax=Homarus americanus TaxID=6706 RepID=UPI001C47611C|nr:cytochrome c oxidase subunit 7A2, mitochondrial-like [Homarus americanus]
MRFKFSHFTGRLSAPSPLNTPSKFGNVVEGPKIQYQLGTKVAVTDTPKHRGYYSAVPEVLQQKMRTFQMPNGLPVHVKGGPIDTLLYVFTAAVCFIGFVESCRVYYVLSYPTPPPKDE